MSALLAALLYGVLSVDHFAVGPFLLSRPLTLGPLIGMFFGHGPEGLALGLLGESLWVAVPPSGAAQWDVGLATALACVWAFTTAPAERFTAVPGSVLACAFLVSIPFAVVARRMDQWLRRQMRVLADRARAGLLRGVSEPMWASLVFSLVLWVFKSLVIFFVAEAIGGAVCHAFFPILDGGLAEGLDRAWRLWPALGAATLWHLFSARLDKSRKAWLPKGVA